MKSIKNTTLITFAIAFITTILLLSGGVRLPRLNFVNIFLVIPFLYLVVYIHELGHVLAAKAVGIEINRVLLGKGRDVLRRRVFGILVIIKSQPAGGLTVMGDLKRGFSKPAFAFFVAGGVILQLLVTIAVMVISEFRFSDFVGNTKVDVPSAFVMANILTIAIALMPTKSNFGGVSVPSDGLTLIRIPSMTDKDARDILSAGALMRAFELFESREYQEAQRIYEKCRAAFPDSVPVHFGYATALLKQGEIEAAEMEFKKIESGKHDKRYDALLYNNMAWTQLLRFTPESLAEAAKLSEEAMRLSSNTTAISNTRASVLVASGEYDEGMKLLGSNVRLRGPVDRETNNIVGFMMMAFAYIKKGDLQEAEKYIRVMRENLDHMDEDDKVLCDALSADSEELKVRLGLTP